MQRIAEIKGEWRYLRKFMISVLLAMLFLSGSLIAQEQEQEPLSVDREEFYRQISTILLNTPSDINKKEAEITLERFYPTWSVDRFSEADRAVVRNLIEVMRDRKMRAFPYLHDYIYALTLLGESQLSSEAIIAWHLYAEELLSVKQSAPFGKLLDFTKEFFDQSLLNSRGTFSWYYRRANYTFDLDTTLIVRFEYLDLVCASKNDSSVISKTSGFFNYESKEWLGENGTLFWDRFGEEAGEQIYADYQQYSIDLTETNYQIDSVILHYDRFLPNPVLGRLSEKIMAGPPAERTSYPRVMAYLDNFELPDIFPGIDYYGGIELQGLRLFGLRSGAGDSYVMFRHNDTVFGKVRAEIFRLDEERIETTDAQVSFYFERDSLYHPDIHVKYTAEDKQMMLFNDAGGAEMPPFFNSYHQLIIYSEALYWNVDSTKMFFKNMRGVNQNNKASFVSNNFFSIRDFYRLQGMDDTNPLYTIYNYLHTYGEDIIQLGALAEFMRKPKEQVAALLINLGRKGFLIYDTKSETAIVKRRLYDYLDAKSGQADYDVIRLESEVFAKPNALIDLNDLSLDVFGVPEVFISDSQDVYIYPFDKTISFRKNRDFTFDGRVRAGLFDFYAQNSTFVYDSFMLNLNYIDSLTFMVKTKGLLKGNDSLVKVKNVLTVLNGKIYVDDPYNKSGLRAMNHYPIFVSNEDSYVYFNKRTIQDSTLNPEDFYYVIEPFTFDSLSTFTTQGMAFEGALASAGIFPTIRQPLVVMDDYSLGFTHQTPHEGYPVYDGKAIFSSEIKLSNNGFEGIGTLDYLTATTASDRFLFYPDSLTGIGNYFTLNENPDKYDYPQVQGDSVDIHWVVDTNLMAVNQLFEPFILYNKSTLEGDIGLSPENLMGDGSFFFDQSEIISNSINFKYSELTADSADFYLRLKEQDTVVFRSKGYFARIDFQQQKGWFDNLYENSFVEFPFNKYISTLEEVEWIMDESRLELKSEVGADYETLSMLNDKDLIDYNLSGPEFISVHKEQDSLRFYAGQASYSLSQYTIDIEGVKLIKVADAAIFPFNEAVKISRDANMSTLMNARIIADTANKYHHIYDAEANIFSRHQFMATGYVDYVDRNKTAQPIFLSSISVNNFGKTVGFGEITPEDIFFLSPEYFFTGQVSLLSNKKNYRFTGGYKINENCIGLVDNWVAFDQQLDPEKLYFNITDTTRDTKGRRARFGLAFSERDKAFYPMILQAKKDSSDFVLIQSSGQIDYDIANNAFRVGSARRLNENVLDDNLVALYNERCILEGDGILDLGLDFNMLKWNAAGTFKHLIIPDSTYINTVLSLAFHMDEMALSMMTDSLRISNARNTDVSSGAFPLYLQKRVGSQRANEVLTDLSLYGQMRKMPPELAHTLIFTDLNLKWDTKTRSYLSYGPIGIGYIAGQSVNKYVDGYVQIEMGRTGSGIHMYLEVSKDQWYLFSYKHGIMQVISSDNAFNTQIEMLKQDKRVLNPNSDTDYYEFVISTRRKKVDFVRTMETLMKFN
ncbi:MAG: hypothetical protein KQH67_05120 [Bacteroidetes bacterium]|nr:hypothetical protein [Bacteroidota bacterium]